MKKIITLLLLAVMACAVMLPVFATDVSFTVYSEDEKNYIHSENGAWDTGTHRCHDAESYTTISEYLLRKANLRKIDHKNVF